MAFSWQNAFNKCKEIFWIDNQTEFSPYTINNIDNLNHFLDLIHVKYCLLRPFFEQKHYPLVQPHELLPSFESKLYEYVNLPGFSMVVLDRTVNYFQEIFQFDILHSPKDNIYYINGPATPFEPVIIQQNYFNILSRLPKLYQEKFKRKFDKQRLTNLASYPRILPFLLYMDRGHLMAKDSNGEYYLSGIYASFPSDLDSELKRYGLKIGKFKPGDNYLYELNRNFVYQFLMELYGFPIASERRTSAALFARRLFKMGEDFIIRVLGQSDRTITTLYKNSLNKNYPKVEKLALVSLAKIQKEQLKKLDRDGFIIRDGQPTVILKVHYRQHKYDPNNIRTDRALSVSRQEVIHPLTGEVYSPVNILKDTSQMTLALNDIVKGEYFGRIKYKRNEIVENTETHSKRLKFLYAWLKKHQRRIIGYSEEFYQNITKVLDNYLLSTENYPFFENLRDLYQEVWEQYSYIQQARKIKELEDLKSKRFRGKKINYLQMLQYANKNLQNLKFEAVNYFDSVIKHAIHICDKILGDKYILKKYLHNSEDNLTEYGRKIKKQYGLLVNSVDELKAIRGARSELPSGLKRN